MLEKEQIPRSVMGLVQTSTADSSTKLARLQSWSGPTHDLGILFLKQSYYNLDLSFCLSVYQSFASSGWIQATYRIGMQGVWKQFHHTIIYHQFVRVRVWEEPHWQGASIVYNVCFLRCIPAWLVIWRTWISCS